MRSITVIRPPCYSIPLCPLRLLVLLRNASNPTRCIARRRGQVSTILDAHLCAYSQSGIVWQRDPIRARQPTLPRWSPHNPCGTSRPRSEPLSFSFTLYQKLNTSRQGFGALSTSSCRAPEHRSAEPTQKGAAMPVGKAPRPTAAGLAPPGMGGWLNLQAGPNLHCPVFM